MASDRRPARARIRELRSTDRERWDELWAGYLEFYKTTLAPQITEETWRRLLDAREQPYGFAALDAADRVIGFVHYHFHLSTWSVAGYCYLEDLFVDPACRGAGAGRALIEAVYRAADERGVARVYWHTENDNTRAQALYDQLAVLAPYIQYRRG
jgi:ribosomal protein S18 acetylase RimI-like enzyme